MSPLAANPGRVCVLSGRFPSTEFPSVLNHRAYAHRHGYTFIHCNWPTTAKNRYMTKLHFVREYVLNFDYIFWLDDDAFFVDFSKSLDFIAEDGDALVHFCKSPTNKKIFTHLSSGQFLLKGGAAGLEFVDKVLATDLETVRDWWHDDLGMFTNGDQDAIVYQRLTNPAFEGRIKRHDYMAFNSRLADLEENQNAVFLLHFTGPRPRKLADHSTAAGIIGRGPSFVEPELESAFQSPPKPKRRFRLFRRR